MAPFGRGDRERTAADREAARLERERRRAVREGREPPESLPATDEPNLPSLDEAPLPPRDEAPDEPVAREAEPLPVDPEPAAAEPEPPAPAGRDSLADSDQPPDPDPLAEPDPEPEQPELDSARSLEPVGAIHARRTISLPRAQTDEDSHHTEGWDRPIGTVRVSRAQYQAQPGASGMPPHRILPVRKPRRIWRRRIIALLALIVVAGIAVLAYLTYQPFQGKGHGAVVVTIPEGTSAGDIGKILARNDVVDSSFFFGLRARISGDRGKLLAGTYSLKHSMPYKDALAALTAGPAAAPTIAITLPEGPSRRELAPRVKAAGVRGNYVTASSRSSVLHPRNYGAPRRTNTLEGFLFPDTYQLRRGSATARQLVAMQLRDFRRQFAKVDLARARRRHMSAYDVLIIASMIEREALVPKDRKLISAVIYNRLRRDIPLGIDAVLRYRLHNWSRPLKESELHTRSAYNTRERIGLPPTPIGNPGLASIQAAADPANVKYLYYVVKPCGNGAHAFSSTNARFQKDVAAYNAARKKRGGKDPSRC